MKSVIILLVSISTLVYSQVPPPPVLGPGESYTKLWSVTYDYQSSGSVRYFVQDQTKTDYYCAILMSQQDTSYPVEATKHIYYSYRWEDGTWYPDPLSVSSPMGFPSISIYDGVPIIATQGTFGGVFRDILFTGGVFYRMPNSPALISPQVSGTANGNIVLGGNDDSTRGYRYTVFRGFWSALVNLNNIGGDSSQTTIESASNGEVSIFGTNRLKDHSLTWYLSPDNGLTFNQQSIFPYILDGDDTLYVSLPGGLQAVYDQNNNVHLVFATYKQFKVQNIPHCTGFRKSRIYHWSKNTGLNLIAGNSNILTLEDSLVHDLTSPLCQPAIGITMDGNLMCSFTTFLKGNKQVVQNGELVNAGEIFTSKSTNSGINWSTPVNFTNTPHIEEKHSSLVRKSFTNNINIYFLRDMKAGNWVNVPEWGKAPVYGIIKNFILVGSENSISNILDFKINQNYPNPFNPVTKINYELGKREFVSLNVFDSNGKLLKILINKTQEEGVYEIEFKGNDFASGVYYYTLTAGKFKQTKKMILLK